MPLMPPPKHLTQYREPIQLRNRMLHHNPVAGHYLVGRLLRFRQRAIPPYLKRDDDRHLWVVLVDAVVALVHHRPFALRQLVQQFAFQQQCHIVRRAPGHRLPDRFDHAIGADGDLGLHGVRLLLARIVRLLGVITLLRPLHALLLAVDHQAHLREGGHDVVHGAEFAAVCAGAVEGEVVEGVQDLQDSADIELGIALGQTEEEAEEFVGRVDPQPDHRHEQAMAIIVGKGVASLGGALAWQAAACGAAAVVQTNLSGEEAGQEAFELVRGHARKAPKRTGVVGQRFVLKHLTTSTLPDKSRAQMQKDDIATTLFSIQRGLRPRGLRQSAKQPYTT